MSDSDGSPGSLKKKRRRLTVSRHDWEDDFEPEEADSYAGDHEEDEPTISCPHCRKEIHEESEQCPHCHNYISQEDSPSARKPWWVILGALAALYVVYRWIVGG